MKVKISIITATFNSVKTISTTINSVNNQTYQNIEHIFVDGCSTDETLSKIRSQALPSSLINSEVDQGIYDALNRGVGLSTGEVIGFLHSDDYYASEDTLSKIAKVFEDPNISICYGDLEYVDALDTNKVIRYWKAGVFGLNSLKNGWMPPHPTVYVRRSLIVNAPFKLSYSISADYEWILRIFKLNNISIYYIPEVLVKMRTGGVSNSSLKNILLKTKEDLKAIMSNSAGGIFTLVLKNIRKISQLVLKRKKKIENQY